MTEIALRVQKLDANDLPIGNIDFLEHEVLECLPLPRQQSRVDRAQNGAPTQFIFGDPWHEINVRFRIQDNTTAARLTTLRNSARNGEKLRVIPAFIDDQSLFFDCLISLEIPSAWLMSGRFVRGQTFDLLFTECSKSAQVSISTDIVLGGAS